MSQFRVPLSSEESSYYQAKFHELDPEGLGIATGEKIRPLFAETGLNNDLLAEIWGLGDYENHGFLNFQQFSICCRLIGYCQSLNGNTNNLTLNASNYATFTKMPQFGSENVSESQYQLQQPQGQQIPRITSTNSFNSNNQTIPTPTATDLAKYYQLFERSANGQQFINGETAREIFMKANLPTPTLGAIWELCDQNQAGFLTKPQFVLALYLVQLVMSNTISNVPSSLPPHLWQTVEQFQPQQPQQPGSPQMRNVSNNSTGMSLDRNSSMIKKTFNSASSDWTLSMDKKKSFDAIFDSLDKSKLGKLGSDVLVPFFLTSKLSQDILATIWDLADIQNNAEFTKLEFAIAMFLIQKKNAGIALPDIIPEELLNSPSLGLNHQPMQQQQQQQQQQQPEPHIPNRSSKPTFEQPPQTHASPVKPNYSGNGNSSALNDLLGLDHTSFSPVPPPMSSSNPLSAASTGNSMNGGSTTLTSSNTGLRKFKPSSTFGQSIIKEETEPQQQQQQQQQSPAQPQFNAQSQQSAPVEAAMNTGTLLSKSTYQSALPNVPNFAAFAIPEMSSPSSGTSRSMNPNMMDNTDSSFKLSQATTDLANLSNQVRSLSNQSSILTDRKTRNEQELQKVNATKMSIENKLTTLRSSYQQETQQAETVERMLAQSKLDVGSLTEQLNVAQANCHAVELNLSELQQQLVDVENSNSQIKEKIGNFNSMSQSLQTELTEKQAQLQQKQSMLGINEKQLEVSELNSTNLQKEITALASHFDVFVNKKKELDEYSSNIEQQHTLLETRHQEFVDKSKGLEEKHSELDQRENDIKQRTLQIDEQEKIYHDQINKLQQMFEHLNLEKQKLDTANEDLENQHYEYASRVQDLADKQMKLAMGEVPSKEEIASMKEYLPTNTSRSIEKDVEKSVDKSAKVDFSSGSYVAPSVTDKSEDVFDASKSVTEGTSVQDAFMSNTMILPDDTNMEDVPKHTSATSSTFNNPPQSETFASDNLDVEIPGSFVTKNAAAYLEGPNVDQKLEEEQLADDNASFNSIEKSPVAGKSQGTLSSFNNASSKIESEVKTATNIAIPEEKLSEKLPSVKGLEEKPLSKDMPQVLTKGEHVVTKSKINEEFPPIQELHIDESDSSEDEDEDEDDFKDFDNVQMPTAAAQKDHTDAKAKVPAAILQSGQHALDDHSDFKGFGNAKVPAAVSQSAHDEFNNFTNAKVPAAVSQSVHDDFNNFTNAKVPAAVSQSVHDDFNNFTNAKVPTAIPQNAQNAHNDFQDFSNAKTVTSTPQNVNDEFKDFDDLQQANVDDFDDDEDDEVPTQSVDDSFVSVSAPTSATKTSANGKNPEWDDLFSGLDKPVNQKVNEPLVQPEARKASTTKKQTVSPIKIATTPKSLAIEELCSMGFSEDEAKNALQSCNWDLDTATNFLLDA